ncbi:hypothetical protein T265_00590 [Opisthorchis viverrini]|uniref:Uncharacterized protein n=1 Tax=Opisthorchis viverrini TaxID=6198 RepID=A0A075A169_OPIVI|nr:hypothetical protein T265_00590 [Opisthorchis viverrini]KER33473.1 hypothetical protein T265_00590 [Opisthorchis viverrini]
MFEVSSTLGTLMRRWMLRNAAEVIKHCRLFHTERDEAVTDANEDTFLDGMNDATTDVRAEFLDINLVVGADELLDGRK